MWQTEDLILVAVSLSVSVLACTVAGDGGGRPLVTAVTRDAATSLYTIPVKSGSPLVVDLSGPIVWSTCDDATSHDTLECNSIDCMRAHRFHPPNCQHTGYGMPDPGNPYRCKCTTHPHNPVSGDTASGDMTRVVLSANATDGRNPLGPVSFTAVTSCAPDSLLAGLPAGAVGVAGLARSGLSFPAQVARTQGVANSFRALPREPRPWRRRHLRRGPALRGERAVHHGARVPSPAGSPFELCYNSSRLSLTRFGYFVPTVGFGLEGGPGWAVQGINSMALVIGRPTACFGFVEMKEGDKAGYGGGAAPAVVLGGLQMEENLVVFNEEKQTMAFTGQINGRGLFCSNFNFTVPA
ncbi:unnamed protein product [Triticum turgidum subsp. durum]|uniref:Xylanase inhibitor N-terminal domain-containing protein n=1 Tax=Triticum turgidum subsp. durum TaxID=4567 RepID=A0A9R0RXN8_TRITD|nr:unnamed protein product [Triticum turgidum subsp. durum]